MEVGTLFGAAALAFLPAATRTVRGLPPFGSEPLEKACSAFAIAYTFIGYGVHASYIWAQLFDVVRRGKRARAVVVSPLLLRREGGSLSCPAASDARDTHPPLPPEPSTQGGSWPSAPRSSASPRSGSRYLKTTLAIPTRTTAGAAPRLGRPSPTRAASSRT